jgi:hypothetical protein
LFSVSSSRLAAERLVASSGPNQSEDVLLCASLLQRSDQHFRVVSLLARFPDAASGCRGKIILAQSHAALGDWDGVKVAPMHQQLLQFNSIIQTVLEHFDDSGTKRVLLSGLLFTLVTHHNPNFLHPTFMRRRHSSRPPPSC